MVKYLPILLLLLSSCASWHCRKCMESGRFKSDTLTFQKPVTFREPESKADTTIQNPNWIPFGPSGSTQLLGESAYIYETIHDTVFVNKDRLHMKIVPGKTIYVEGKCDSIVKEVIVEVPYLVKNKAEIGWWTLERVIGSWFIAFMIGVVLCFLFLQRRG